MKFDSPRPEEFALIYDSWAASFRKSPWAGCVPNSLWDQVSRACALELLNRGRVIVAVQELEPVVLENSSGRLVHPPRRVMGYSVSEPGCLHWLYVKRDYRGIGVGRQLLAETTRDWTPASKQYVWEYTHRTHSSAAFLGKGWLWNPVSARVKATS